MDLDIGMPAPTFSLTEPLTGKTVSLSNFHNACALLVIIMCNHCPFVKMLKGMYVEVCIPLAGILLVHVPCPSHRLAGGVGT